MPYLLDTNAWIVYLKRPDSKIRDKLSQTRSAEIRLCSVVKAELWYGAQKYGNAERRKAILRKLFGPYHSFPFDDAAAEVYGKLRHELELAGKPIGPNDLMIASIALHRGVTLVTHNVQEFSRVSGLQIEDWELQSD